jgi:hypothetical protein
MFGFSSSDDNARRYQRMRQLVHSLYLLSKVEGTCEVSIPQRDRELLVRLDDELKPHWPENFRFRLRPDFATLSENRAYIERRYTRPGEILGIFDADLQKLLTLGYSFVKPRRTIKDPATFATVMKEVRRGAFQNPFVTVWMLQDRNYPRPENKLEDLQYPLFRSMERDGIPKTRSHVFFYNAKAVGQYAPEGQGWNRAEDVYRLLVERDAGGKFGVVCWRQTYVTFDAKGNYEHDPEWQTNRQYLEDHFGYSLKHRTRDYKKRLEAKIEY